VFDIQLDTLTGYGRTIWFSYCQVKPWNSKEHLFVGDGRFLSYRQGGGGIRPTNNGFANRLTDVDNPLSRQPIRENGRKRLGVLLGAFKHNRPRLGAACRCLPNLPEHIKRAIKDLSRLKEMNHNPPKEKKMIWKTSKNGWETGARVGHGEIRTTAGCDNDEAIYIKRGGEKPFLRTKDGLIYQSGNVESYHFRIVILTFRKKLKPEKSY